MKHVCVLDASTALRWAFREPDRYAEAVLDRLLEDAAIVPSLWWLEVANTLLVAERAARTTGQRVAETFASLHDLHLVTEPTAFNVTAAAAIYDLARRRGLTTYDATYLDLAIRYGLPLATLDGPLQQAAAAEGVALFRPESVG